MRDPLKEGSHFSKVLYAVVLHMGTDFSEFVSGWQTRTKPLMCAYKLVTANFDYFGLRSKVGLVWFTFGLLLV